jgi:hypothetical protein
LPPSTAAATARDRWRYYMACHQLRAHGSSVSRTSSFKSAAPEVIAAFVKKRRAAITSAARLSSVTMSSQISSIRQDHARVRAFARRLALPELRPTAGSAGVRRADSWPIMDTQSCVSADRSFSAEVHFLALSNVSAMPIRRRHFARYVRAPPSTLCHRFLRRGIRRELSPLVKVFYGSVHSSRSAGCALEHRRKRSIVFR